MLQVIQPTPILSPCGSEGTLYDRPVSPAAAPSVSGLSVPKLAPLASISSCAVSAGSEVECKSTASDCRSIGSDSVFLDEDCIDTEDEAEEFSTDSENDNNNNYNFNNAIYGNHSDLCETASGRARVPFAEHLQICRYPRTLAGRWHNVTGTVCRRYSSPNSQKVEKTAHNVRHPSADDDEQFPSCSKSCDTFVDSKMYLRPPIPLPQSDDDDSLSDSDTIHNEQQQDNNSERKQSEQHSQSQQITLKQCDKDETEDDKTIEMMSSPGSSCVFTRKEDEETEKKKCVDETKNEVNVPKIGKSEFSEVSVVQCQAITSASCDHLVKALTEKSKILSSSMKDIVEHCSSWSQETLF